MTAFSLATPGTFTLIVRPLLGMMGLLAAFAMSIQPLTISLLRASLMLVKPRETSDQRSRMEKLRSVLMLNRMANDLDKSQPNLAAELRTLAGRS